MELLFIDMNFILSCDNHQKQLRNNNSYLFLIYVYHNGHNA